MKKSLSVLLALIVTASMVFANGTAEAGKAAGVKDPDFVNGKFKTTRNITVEIFDRSNDGGSNPEDNYFTKFIKDGMLRDYNVNVTFKRVPRWTEVEALNNLLAAGDAPDVCVTYSYPTIQQYGNMGGVLDMNPYLTEYKKFLPDMWNLLKDTNIYYDQDPVDKHVWALEALLFQNNRTNTFVREDWLKKLNLKEPTTMKEFEAVLKAFKDNAKVLLGDNADKMIPFSIGVDVGWRSAELVSAFVPNKITDKEMYINGFDDRRLLWPGFKDGMKVLNKWYNDGLIWKDFPLYAIGTKDEDNLIKAGYVGAFIHNWDYPYRDGEQGVHANLKKLVGPDAGFIAVEVFKNDAGKYRKYLSNPVDRKIFFPSTNKEPLASLLYVNWLSKFENRKYLQTGDKDVHHVVMPDGAIKVQPVKGEKIMNSGTNIDYTIVINGLDLGDPVLTAKSLALGYAGVEARYIEKAKATQLRDARISPHFNVGEITTENGMDAPLKEKRNNFLVQSIVAKPTEFDGIYDKGMKDWLASGGQAIIDERRTKFEAAFGKK
jgi:putative aldouronate transport system substrate-binding protein